MAKCSICGKGVVYGQNVSHSNRKTNRTWKPNIRKVKANICLAVVKENAHSENARIGYISFPITEPF